MILCVCVCTPIQILAWHPRTYIKEFMEMLPAMLNEDNVVEVYFIPFLIRFMIFFYFTGMTLFFLYNFSHGSPCTIFFSVAFAVQELFRKLPHPPPSQNNNGPSLKVSESVAWFFKSFVVVWEQYLGNIEFCLHYTTEHTQKLRHERVGQPDPRDVFFTTISLQQSG